MLIEKNALVKGELTLRTIWFGADFPLSTVGLWAQRLAWGKNPLGYHAMNLALHTANALLLWRLLRRLRAPAAWLGAVLFAVHPVCAGSVAWISELKNVLSLPFALLSFILFLDSEAGWPGNARSRLKFWLSLAAVLVALLAKTSIVMLPCVLAAWVWWQHGRIGRTDVLKLAPYFALALVFGLLSLWFQTHQAITGTTVQEETFAARIAGAGWVLWFYLGKALAPLGLCAVYPRWQIVGTSPLAWVPLAAWLGVLAVCWRFRATWGRHGLFGLVAFTASLFPVLGLFNMYFMVFSRVSDHFAYAAVPAVTTLIAAALGAWLPAAGLRAAGGCLLAALGLLTWQRAKVFASDETLWRDTLAKNPTEWNANNNLACLLAERSELDAAIEHFQKSLASRPANAQAHGNLAQVLVLKNRFDEAEPHFQTSLKLRPKEASVHLGYADALAARGRNEDALRHYRAAVWLEAKPDNRSKYAMTLLRTGDVAGAVQQYRTVLTAQEDNLEALNNLAFVLATTSDATLRNGAEAVRLAQRACRLTGYSNAQAYAALGTAYAEVGDFSEAIATAQRAVEIASAEGNQRIAQLNRQLIGLYRARRPYHEPPRQPAEVKAP